jgi:hypothetical protein
MSHRTVKAIARGFLARALEVRLNHGVHNVARLGLIFPPLDLIGLLFVLARHSSPVTDSSALRRFSEITFI